MRTDELLKAIGDIDEKYIAEASEPIVPKWKKYARWAAIAATICVVVGGGTMLALLKPESSGGSKDAMVSNESGNAGDEDGVPSGSADSEQKDTDKLNTGGISQETDYAFLFQSRDKWDITYEAKFMMGGGGSISTVTNSSELPEFSFDTSQFTATNVTRYARADETIKNTEIQFTGEDGKSLRILVNTDGYYDRCRAKDLHDGVEQHGITVYGYDLSVNADGSDLLAFFTINGEAYSISAGNMSYNELGAIIDEIIQNRNVFL